MNDRFEYGRRQIIHYDRTGQPTYTYLPLTEADFLNPQPADEFVHGTHHEQDVRVIRQIFRHLYRYNPFMTVLSNVKLLWDVDGLAQPAPDIAIVANMVEPERPRTEFDVRAEGVRPQFVLEVTSPRLAQLDLERKVAIYQQAGVKEYMIIDSGLRAGLVAQENKTYTVLGYRLVHGQYEPIAPDTHGRLFSATNKVSIGPTEQGDGFIVVEQRTGMPITADAAHDEGPATAYAEAANRAHSIASQLDFLRSS